MSDKRDIINMASTTLPAPTSSAMLTTAEGTGVATVVVPVPALAPEVDPEATRTADHSPLPGALA